MTLVLASSCLWISTFAITFSRCPIIFMFAISFCVIFDIPMQNNFIALAFRVTCVAEGNTFPIWIFKCMDIFLSWKTNYKAQYIDKFLFEWRWSCAFQFIIQKTVKLLIRHVNLKEHVALSFAIYSMLVATMLGWNYDRFKIKLSSGWTSTISKIQVTVQETFETKKVIISSGVVICTGTSHTRHPYVWVWKVSWPCLSELVWPFFKPSHGESFLNGNTAIFVPW